MLLYIVLGVLLVILLFFLAARSWRFAVAIRAFFEWLASVPKFFAEQFDQWRGMCKVGIEKMLPTPLPDGIEKEEEEKQWRSIDVTIMRLSYVFLCVCIIGGDLPFTQLRNQFLLGLETLTHIPLPLDILGAVIWLAVSAMLLEWVIDLAGKVPRGANILPHVKNKFWRWVLLAGASLLLIASIIDFGLLFYYGQYPIAVGKLNQDVKTLGLHIVLAFGIVSGVAGMIALTAFFRRGIAGIITLFLGLLYCVFTLVHLPFALLATWIGDFGKMIGVVQPIQPVFTSIVVQPESLPAQRAATPAIAGTIPGKDVVIVNTTRTIVFGSFGLSNLELQARVIEALIRKHGTQFLLAYGGTDPYHTTQQTMRLPGVPGAIDITPDPTEIGRATAGSSSAEETFESLAQLLVSKITAAYAQHLSLTGTIFVFADLRIDTYIQEPLERLSNLLPMAKIVLVTSLPTMLERDEDIAKALANFKVMQHKGMVDAMIVWDPISPLALAQKKEKDIQIVYTASTIASMCVAPYHDTNNPSLPEMVDRLHRLSPVALSCDSEHLAPGKEALLSKILRVFQPSAEPKGWGNVNDAIQKTKLAITNAINNPDNRLTHAPFNTNTPFVVYIDAPIRKSDVTRSDFYERNVRSDLAHTYPHAIPAFVRANGVPNFRLGKGYFCSAACLYPLGNETNLIEPEKRLEIPEHKETPDEKETQNV